MKLNNWLISHAKSIKKMEDPIKNEEDLSNKKDDVGSTEEDILDSNEMKENDPKENEDE